ncbi:MAG: GNAT family N-acetyltransferase [Cyanobacteria bacterium P01_F01_bin.33]
MSEQEREGEPVAIAELTSVLTDGRCYLLLALADSEPVGLLSAFRFTDVKAGSKLVYFYDIEVNREHRRQGIGTALVSKLLQECRHSGVKLIWSGTDVQNAPARGLFAKMATELEGETDAEYEWALKD